MDPTSTFLPMLSVSLSLSLSLSLSPSLYAKVDTET